MKLRINSSRGNQQATSRAILLLVGMLLALSSSLLARQDSRQASERDIAWTEVQTEHFTIYSGAGRQEGLALAKDMEMLHSVLESLAGNRTNSPLPTFVYLFVNDDALQPFKPPLADGRRGSGRAVTGGYFTQSELANYVAINLRTSRSSKETIQHEYLHYFAKHNLPRLPFWFSEGIAEYYSTFTVQDGIGYVGAPIARHLQLLSRSGDFHLSSRELDRLETIRASKELYDDGHSASLTYAQSWAMVHFLLSDDELAQQTLDLMQAIASGQSNEDALRNSFGGGLAEFSSDLKRYFSRGDFPTFRARVGDIATPRLLSLNSLERDIALGNLALTIGNRSLATRLYQGVNDSAQRLAPERAQRVSGYSALGLARLALQVNDYQAALYGAQDAASMLPNTALPRYVEGKAQLAAARTLPSQPNPDSQSSLAFDAAKKAFRQALELQPNLTAALVASGEAWLRDPRTSIQPPSFSVSGIRNLQKAADLLPWRQDIAAQLAMLHAMSGEFAKAVTVLVREAPRFQSEDALRSAWNTIGSIETSLLYRALSRDQKLPLPSDQLDWMSQRADTLMDRVQRLRQLDAYYDRAEELQRLARIERLWTTFSEISELSVQPKPGQTNERVRDNAKTVVTEVLEQINDAPELDSPRIDELEHRANQLLFQLQQLP